MIDIEKIKASKTTEELIEFGILNIDKPSGPTSFGIDEFVKKTLGLRKMSHFGTLDPKVTGVLPIALNRACKLTGFFIGEDKEYVGVMSVHGKVSKEEVEKVISEKFVGIITQLPPLKSRVKREKREREIMSYDLIEEKVEKEQTLFIFQTACQGGTYIRKLVHDLGEALGIGAHMLELRRIRAGIFSELGNEILNYPSVNLYDFEKAFEEWKKGNDKLLRNIIIPGEVVSKLYPVVFVKEKSVSRLFTGKPIHKEDLESEEPKEEGRYCIFGGNKFVGVYHRVFEDKIILRGEFVFQPVK